MRRARRRQPEWVGWQSSFVANGIGALIAAVGILRGAWSWGVGPRTPDGRRSDRRLRRKPHLAFRRNGIVSTASLILGVAAAGTSRAEILVAGVAGLAAGAMFMAPGEYVSVSFQQESARCSAA